MTAKLRWPFVITLAVTLMLFSLTGCGGKKDGQTAGDKSQGNNPVKGGTLNLALNTDFKSLDPAQAGEGQTIRAVQLLYSGLLRYTGSTNSDFTGALAESWKWADDGTSITFKLRNGLVFSDGSPLTAGDVAFTFTRLLDPKTKAPYQGTYSIIKGAQDFKEGKAKTVAGIVVVDPQTIRFELEKPVPYFLNLVGLPTAGIVSKKAVEKYGAAFAENPVGAGPFVLEKWTRGQELVLARNPKYYREGMPYLDKIHFKLGVSDNLQMMMLQKGEIDLIAPVASSDYASVMADPKLKSNYLSAPGPRVFYIGMNVEITPFDNKLVRQALNYAVDKERLIQLQNGRGEIMKGIMPPWVKGYDESVRPYPYDPEKARQLLAQAGFPNGFETDFYVPDFMGQPKIAASVQSDLEKVGVKLNIKQQSYPIFRQTVKERRKVPIFALQWATDFYDPQNILSMLLSGSTAGQQNFSWYNNPNVNKLIEEADRTMDPAKRTELYRQAQNQIWEDAPWIFEFYGIADAVKSPKVKPDVAVFYRLPTEYQHFDEVWKLP